MVSLKESLRQRKVIFLAIFAILSITLAIFIIIQTKRKPTYDNEWFRKFNKSLEKEVENELKEKGLNK
jgi:hypothetical protein